MERHTDLFLQELEVDSCITLFKCAPVRHNPYLYLQQENSPPKASERSFCVSCCTLACNVEIGYLCTMSKHEKEIERLRNRELALTAIIARQEREIYEMQLKLDRSRGTGPFRIVGGKKLLEER